MSVPTHTITEVVFAIPPEPVVVDRKITTDPDAEIKTEKKWMCVEHGPSCFMSRRANGGS